MSSPKHASYDGKILHLERDLQLGLKHPEWPQKECPLGEEDEVPPRGAERWQRAGNFLHRTIAPKQRQLWEVMLRFPNAPIYGLRRREAVFQHNENRSNFHTFRVIGLPPEKTADPVFSERRIRDVYILHNGLNETNEFDLHYQLASRLLVESKRPAVCIIRPFPGHLTRYPCNDAFAERPLDTFLLDSGDLFRQFIRFMLETRWLLSILVPRRKYNVLTGGKLVDCGEDRTLAGQIFQEWNAMYEASARERGRPPMDDLEDIESATEKTIKTLRNELLQWGALDDNGGIPAAADEEPPAVHLVGYSLGGFLAQSAFFAWPYAISGCVTLFGGGELRKLAPTAFAQPEEWQSVLHSLRYELDRAMGDSLRAKNGETIGGVEQETFEYLLRVFYEVFLQYYQGSYKTRLAEFIQRMLFVTGGQDPIVRPDNILEAAPPEGVNLINIAGMSHFPMKPKERVQTQQREFWLEQLGQIIPAFAEQADERRREVLQRSWLNDKGTNLHTKAASAYKVYKEGLDKIGEPPSTAAIISGVSLSDRWFGKEIQRLCDFIYEEREDEEIFREGWVLVSRNEIPPVFQTAAVLRRYAAALHHSEDLAADEFWLALRRREALEKGRGRVTLMVTDTALELAKQPEPTIFSPRSETPGVARLSDQQHKESLEYFEEKWLKGEPDAVRTLNHGGFKPVELGDIGEEIAQGQGIDLGDKGAIIQVRFLPDAWIGIAPELLKKLESEYVPDDLVGDRRRAETAIVAWGGGLARERNERKLPAGQREHAFGGVTLEKALEDRTLVIVEFSRAGLNPRYRGQRLTHQKYAGEVLIHWALAYEAAIPEAERPIDADF